MFTKGQQMGVLFLVLLIVTLMSVFFFVDFPNNYVDTDSKELVKFRKEMDSLRSLEIENRKPKIYPFNPNYITDYKGYTLGMTVEEIDRLIDYRNQNKWINSAEQFQEVTQVSDSLLNKISPYFKFPEWVTNPKSKSNHSVNFNSNKTFDHKIDLNKATAIQLQRINGVGAKLSQRIIRYRNSFIGGFIANVQLKDVYGLSPEVIERILKKFTVKTPRQVQKIDLNNATAEELVTIQHIDYDIAYNILEQRTLREGFKSFEELTKVKGFPIEKIDIIQLYLFLE